VEIEKVTVALLPVQSEREISVDHPGFATPDDLVCPSRVFPGSLYHEMISVIFSDQQKTPPTRIAADRRGRNREEAI
jgi:hypothetical protein